MMQVKIPRKNNGEELFTSTTTFIRSINPSTREVAGYIMTPHTTIDGRRIDKDAFNHPHALTEFFRVPLFLWNHDPDYPIGRPKRLEMRGESGIYGVAIVDDDTIWNWILQGRVRGFSIGFKVLEWEWEDFNPIHDPGNPLAQPGPGLISIADEDAFNKILLFKKAQLFDISVVSCPANTYCLFVEDEEAAPFEIWGFPEQFRKADGAEQYIEFERVARSGELPLHLPKRNGFDMFIPFQRKNQPFIELLEMNGISYSPDDWWVYGYATKFNEVDSYGTRMTKKAIEKALADYKEWANIREQHDHTKAVGTAPLLKLDDEGLFIAAKISKGAKDTWEKVLDGTLKGFSLGGIIKANGIIPSKENGKVIKNITDVELSEISLVDRPAVKSCGFVLACREEMPSTTSVETPPVLETGKTTEEEEKTMSNEDVDIGTMAEDEEVNENETGMTIEEIQRAVKMAMDKRAKFTTEDANYQTTALDTNLEKTRASGSTDLPLDMERSWDSRAAERRVREWAGATDEPNARYRQAFFWYDENAPENFTSYKLPFADVVEGQLTAIWRGVVAAMIALKGGRGGVDIPEEDRRPVYNKIVAYYRKAGKEPPEFSVDKEFDIGEFSEEEQAIYHELFAEEEASEKIDSSPSIAEQFAKLEQRIEELHNNLEKKFNDLVEMLQQLSAIPLQRSETAVMDGSSSNSSIENLSEQVQTQNQVIQELKKRLEALGEGQQAAKTGSGERKSIWEGVVPSVSRFKRKS